MKKNAYNWTFTTLGGASRVKIKSGADIAHLGELDRKLWTVLSCPAKSLEFDQKTLDMIDADHEGNIRSDEVVAAAKWLTSVLKDTDLLLTRGTEIPFSAFNEEDPEGAKLLASAKHILANLKLEKDSISLEDTADLTKVFAESRFNGDGVITPATPEDESLAAVITTIIENIGKAMDRSGVDGVNADHIEAFYTALADYAAWQDAATGDVLPYGDKTADALAAVEALKDKVADYFMRCKLISFDPATAPAVDVSVEKLSAIEGILTNASSAIAEEPLAKPTADGILPLDAVNPAWGATVEAMRALVLDADKKTLTEDEWNGIVAKFAPYTAWLGEKKGAEVEGLGLEKVQELLKAGQKDILLKLVEEDKALEEEALSIEAVDKLVTLFHNFYDFLNNYVVFADFYGLKRKAMFQAGRLYIDQRSTDLCIRVDGPSPDISTLSGMYILYCTCTSALLGKTMNIAAVLTRGDVDGLRAGKHAVFYDREGRDWSAVVTSIVENPISIGQAFWAPYKKVGRWISERMEKIANEKNEEAHKKMTTKVEEVSTAVAEKDSKKAEKAVGKSNFDIAQFAGIFAALSMAVGLLGTFFTDLFKGVTSVSGGRLLLISLITFIVLILVISLPSMFLAWRKLRKRDLGPVLNANGWAINSNVLVRTAFGRHLTQVAKAPGLSSLEPASRWKLILKRLGLIALIALIIGLGYLFFTDRLAKYGIPFHKNRIMAEEVTGTEEEMTEEAVEELLLEALGEEFETETTEEAAPEE